MDPLLSFVAAASATFVELALGVAASTPFGELALGVVATGAGDLDIGAGDVAARLVVCFDVGAV